MKKWFVRIVTVLCVFSMLIGLVACKKDPVDPGDHPTPPDPQPPVETMIDIVKDGKTQYKIIRDNLAASGETAPKMAAKLRQAIVDATGCKIGIADDYKKDDASENYEILIGKTNRPEQAQIPEDLAQNEYVIKFTGKKILIYGGSDVALEQAMDFFIATYLGYNAENQTYSKNNLSLPEKLDLKSDFLYPATVYIVTDISNLGNGVKTDDYTFNDITRLIASFQGRMNKHAEENNYYIYLKHDSQDIFWLDYMSSDGKMLDNAPRIELGYWGIFWDTFGEKIREAGLVTWDPEVPATSNVAATVCSVEGYLPVRYSEDENSLYQWLIANGCEVKLDLVDKFTGTGTIPDTDLPSTGSIKNDPYIWAMEKYLDKCNSNMLAYVLDGASCIPENPIYQAALKVGIKVNPEGNQLYSHDYYIYNECFFVDLTCIPDEAPCDDKEQPIGTDAKTLGMILQHFHDKNVGKMCKLMGFPPWYMKYTRFNDHGKTEEVQMEWKFVEFISQYNFLKEADAWSPSWMTNASVYCQYEMTTEKFENPKPEITEEYDENVRYFTIYVGDYDSSAWLKLEAPNYFESSQLGKYPMMWPFNPNLSDRVPMIFDYVYEKRTENDFFVTGDSGAGYVFPSSLPDMNAWIAYNEPYLEKFDLDIVGFIINGWDDLSLREYSAYAQLAPEGSFVNNGPYLTVYNNETPFLMMSGVVHQESVQQLSYEWMYNWLNGSGTNFAAYRTVRTSLENNIKVAKGFMEYANARNDGYTYKYVDPYTLFEMIRQSGQGNIIWGD